MPAGYQGKFKSLRHAPDGIAWQGSREPLPRTRPHFMADVRDQLQQSLGSAYTLGRELGGGGMSRVFVAIDTRLERQVVVKILLPELAAGLNAERFAREIKLAASLQQANIVPVLAAGDSEGLPWYTMPFVEGLSLRQRLERGQVPLAEVLSVLHDVARALTYAHARGVVHRDIKPDNVLLSGETAVVTDFGIAKAISASRTQAGTQGLTQVGTAIGTPAYMAPEQAAGDASTDHRADLYAFGCLAYELLAGRTPFHGLTPHKMLVAHVSERPVSIEALRPDVPPALVELVARCLEKDPDDRPQQASDVLKALEAATTSGATQAVVSWQRIPFAGALGIWVAGTALIALVARAAMIVLGLPDWVFPGALTIAVLAFPLVIFTWYAQRVQYPGTVSSPRFTPGGTQEPDRSGTSVTFAQRAAPHVSWLRTSRWTAIGLAGFVLIVAGFMTLRSMGIGPAGSLLAAGKLEKSAKLLVAEFNVPGADSTLGRVVAEAVKTSLGQSSVVHIVPGSAVSAALERMRRPPTTRLSPDVAREIAQREGVAAIVTGDVATIGGSYVLTVKLLDVATGDALTTAQESAKDGNDLIPAIDRATRSLRGRIGESLKAVRVAIPLSRATTPSLEALREYTAAGEPVRRGDYAGAIAHLERAVAIDTNFASAYVTLSAMLMAANIQSRRADTLLARAYGFRDRVTPRERAQIAAAYYSLRISRGYDRAKALAAVESLTVADSMSAPRWTQLGNLQRSRGEFARAEVSYRRARALEPKAPIANAVVAMVLMIQQRWKAGDSVIAAMRASGMGDYPALPLLQVAGAYARGRVDSADLLTRAAAVSPNADVARNAKAGLQALHRMQGRLAAADRLEAELRAGRKARRSDAPPLTDSIASALEDVWQRGEPALAARRITNALRVEPIERIPMDERPYLELASAYALAGDGAEARRWLARYDADVRDPNRLRQQRPDRARAMSYIAVLERRWNDALREADVASRDADGGPMEYETAGDFHRAYIHAAAGHTDQAIAEFEKFLAEPDLSRLRVDADHLAFTLEKLGELYEAKGNATKAIERYSRFVDLWKNADAELQPRVIEVRKRIERLRKRSG